MEMDEKKRILIAEDYEFTQKLIQGILTGKGYEVVGIAENGSEAISLYEELKPDLIILDMNMPKMNSLKVLREILELDPEANIIAITGYRKIEMKTRKLGAKSFIVKPFEAKTLLGEIERLLAPTPEESPDIRESLLPPQVEASREAIDPSWGKPRSMFKEPSLPLEEADALLGGVPPLKAKPVPVMREEPEVFPMEEPEVFPMEEPEAAPAKEPAPDIFHSDTPTYNPEAALVPETKAPWEPAAYIPEEEMEDEDVFDLAPLSIEEKLHRLSAYERGERPEREVAPPPPTKPAPLVVNPPVGPIPRKGLENALDHDKKFSWEECVTPEEESKKGGLLGRLLGLQRKKR